ncbi:MAG: TrkH family potassium uptake protein, partial [Acidimicrobiales bacterium]
YLASGATNRVGSALFESASGFSTTALTVLDPTQLSSGMQLFRGGTQWLGALIGLLAAVVSLPGVLRGSVHVPVGQGRRLDRLSPSPVTGRRRVSGIYLGLTVLCGLAYAAAGMGAKDSAVHALTTVSTGGFTNRADSFVSYGAGPQIVATIFMTLAGMSYFVFWWVLRGQRRRFLGSTEMWLYFAMIAFTTITLLLSVDGISIRHALFQSASAASTTGLASADWTVFPSSALAALLIATATGAMGASAGGGLRIARAGALVAYARRELRRQLDPRVVTVVKREGRTVSDEELERLTGYQIAHVGLCAIGAFLLAATGVDIVSSLWTAVSALSTAGPSPITGPHGDATNLSAAARLLLIPGMLAGRLTILPLLAAIVGMLQARDHVIKWIKRKLRGRR